MSLLTKNVSSLAQGKTVTVKEILCDIAILGGLSLLGIGLFFWYGLGPALAIPGGVILLLGVIGQIR